MPLAEYRKKRRFDVTSEPAGKDRPASRKKKKLAFVVQKHRATALHYDFRLEWGGVMLSWAVPRGPSYDPKIKRLAMHVEDHPLEYAEFEGIIPAGEYGGGTVMVWDRGHWQPHGDARAAYRSGKLSFTLAGEKLRGDWTLVRMGGPSRGGRKENWLLLKAGDEQARSLSRGDVVKSEPLSVKTGRDLDEIAAGKAALRRARS